ncbi:MFS transporter superfamily [Fusarium oxysporum f. sp. vasinfectum]|nr:MFS transporter superfamily [Fusarium oxysporum f. sp. vasinfectum]
MSERARIPPTPGEITIYADGTSRQVKKAMEPSDLNFSPSPQSILFTSFASLSGLLFGYEYGSVNGIVRSRAFIDIVEIPGTVAIRDDYISLILPILFCGALLGSIAGGYGAESFGRRQTIIVGSAIYSVGVIVQMMVGVGSSDALGSIVAGRFIAGCGMGSLTTGTILYMTESCHHKVRGGCIASFQWCITIGYLAATIIVYAIDEYDEPAAYRILIGIQFLWPCVVGIECYLMPESPRYLVHIGSLGEAYRSLERLRGLSIDSPNLQVELSEVILERQKSRPWLISLQQWLSRWVKSLVRSCNEPPVPRWFLGILMHMVHEWSGITFILFFTNRFLESSESMHNPLLITLILAIVNVCSTPLSLWTVDRYGRRYVLLAGTGGMIVSHFINAIVGVTVAPDSTKAHNDYQHAPPNVANGGIKVWEAARATSAAPVMFTPHTIPGVGTFQDGGLWQNNPLAVALSEAREIWPSANVPDVALSIGTGFHKSTRSSYADDTARIADADPRCTGSGGNEMANTSDYVIINILWKICFFASILRLLLSLMDSPAMDSDKCQRYITRHGLTEHQARQRIFRVDVDFPVECPRMDDLKSIQDVRQEAINQFSSNSDIQHIAELLISSLFFFELTERPCRHESYISFQGRILCDVGPGPQLQRLLSVLVDHRSVFEVCGRLFPLTEMINTQAATMEFEFHVNGTVTEFTSPFTVSLIQSQPSGKPALYIKAGEYGNFTSPNANATCEQALISFLEVDTSETISLQQGDAICEVYPLIHISIPTDTPVGTAKITWLCDNEKPNPCQLLFVQPASPSATASVSSFAMTMECPSSESGSIPQTDTAQSSGSTLVPSQVQPPGSSVTGEPSGVQPGGEAATATPYIDSNTPEYGGSVPEHTESGTEPYTEGETPTNPTRVATDAVPSGTNEPSQPAGHDMATTPPMETDISDIPNATVTPFPENTAVPPGTQSPAQGSDNTSANNDCTCA